MYYLRNIVCGGVTVQANSRRPVYVNKIRSGVQDGTQDSIQVNVGIKGYDHTFDIFVRKIGVEYQSSSTRIPQVSNFIKQ